LHFAYAEFVERADFKNGYTAWQRNVHIVSGDVNLVAELEAVK